MAKRRREDDKPESTRPKGSMRCICGATGFVAIINSERAANGREFWQPGVRFSARFHTTMATCPCPVGCWIRERHEIDRGVGKCPFPEYDPRFHRLETDFMRDLIRWERAGCTGDPPARCPQETPVTELTANPGDAFQSKEFSFPDETAEKIPEKPAEITSEKAA